MTSIPASARDLGPEQRHEVRRAGISRDRNSRGCTPSRPSDSLNRAVRVTGIPGRRSNGSGGSSRAKHLLRQAYGSPRSIRVTAIPVRHQVLRRGRTGQSRVHVAWRVEHPKLSRDHHSGASCCPVSTFQRDTVHVTAFPVYLLLSGRAVRTSFVRADLRLNSLPRHTLSRPGFATALSRDRNSRTSSDRHSGLPPRFVSASPRTRPRTASSAVDFPVHRDAGMRFA